MPDWLRQLVPREAVVAASSVSIGLFVASALAIPWLVKRLPHDYFSRERPPPLRPLHPALRVALAVGRNVLGLLLLLAGVAMLVLPGQGVLSIVVALFLIDFPGKRRVQRRIVGERHVLAAINRLRHRQGRPPLDQPRFD